MKQTPCELGSGQQLCRFPHVFAAASCSGLSELADMLSVYVSRLQHGVAPVLTCACAMSPLPVALLLQVWRWPCWPE